MQDTASRRRLHTRPGKVALAVILGLVIALALLSIPALAVEDTSGHVQNVPGRLNMDLVARYDVDVADPEGGLEIVAYCASNEMAYAVDGVNRVLIAVPMSAVKGDGFVDLTAGGFQIDVSAAAEAAVKGFKYGDITCVAVSPDNAKLAVTIAAEGYNDPGLLAVYPIDRSADTLGAPVYIEVGVQPDMVVFADDNTVLTADEGEPRMGYGVNSAGITVVDPKGSVSIVKLGTETATVVGFDRYDPMRAALVADGVLFSKGQVPSEDFEPEYIAVSSDGGTAYVALQENNALAVLDIASASFTAVHALGFKDHGVAGNELYLNGKANTYTNVLGAYMPDGISIMERAGKTYIFTANEGDGREWSSSVYPEDHEDAGDPNEDDTSYFCNETKVTLNEGTADEIAKAVVIDPSFTDGLPEGKDVLFGARSFSIFEVSSAGLTLVYDSGSDFERTTAQVYPGWFNTSNDKLKLNDRSLKKGPEPENVTVGTVDGRTFAFVALERIGGVMAYDVTDLAGITYSNYINTRDFAAEDGIGGDSGPEGLCFIPAADGPGGEALLIAGCEVTGTMPAYRLFVAPGDLTGKLVILHTNDTHGADVAVPGKSIGTAGVAQLVADYEAAGAEVLLISAGDAVQGDPLVNLSMGATAIDFMDMAGYDLMVPGNHEFDWGYDNLLNLEQAAEFPFISANVLDKASGDSVFDENIVYETVAGKIGVFGITTPETQTKANPENVATLTFLAGQGMYGCAQAQVDELEALGCDHIICVAHLGDDTASEPNRSVDLIDNVEGIDVVIDGHSHSVLDGDENDETILTSAGTKLSHVGVLMVDELDTESFLISARDYSRVDVAVDAAIDAKAAEIDAALSQTFAATEVLLDGNRAPGVRTQETNLGDFAADAILWAANEAVGEGLVDAAITNGGGIRASIAVGDITMKDMKTVFPFGNTISTVEVTGAQLLELLEAATYCTPEAVGAFPQVAGLEFAIRTYIPYESGAQYPDSTYYAPANPGSRVTDVLVAGEPLVLTDTYTIATNNFLAAGGDTYYLFKNCESYNTYVALEDALVNYTAEVLGGVVTAARYGQPAGRITIVEEAALPFADVPAGVWFHEAVAYVYTNELFRGVTSVEFAPYRNMTRAMFATVLYRMEGEPPVTGASFPDVPAGSYYENAAVWASANGIFEGNGVGFDPDGDITRQQAAAVLYRYALSEGYDTSGVSGLELPFTDSSSIATWAVEAVKYCWANAIILGRDGGAFAPDDGASRAEVATMLTRFATQN